MDQIEQMIASARTWRGMDSLIVTVRVDEQNTRDESVRLGIARGRWRRVQQQLSGLEVLGARGYQKEQLVGTWTAAEPDEPDVDDEEETPAQSTHRFHTRWVMTETRRLYGDFHQTLLKAFAELVSTVVEMSRSMRPGGGVSTPPQTEDEAAKTLQMLLAAAMMPKGGNDDGRASEPEERRGDSGPAGQGQSSEPGKDRPI